MLDVVFARQSHLQLLLDALENGGVHVSMLDAARRERLLTNRDQDDRQPRQRIAAGGRHCPPVGSRCWNATGRALALERDRQRGQAVFEKQCSKCHKLGDQGYAVGPDLLTAKTRADETLISDILDPSSQITVGYNTYNVVTANGRIFSGVLVSETATGITLRAEEGKESVILRQEIDELTTSTISMMPENLDQEVSPQDVADLLGFLRQKLGSAAPPELVLFDDEADFARCLNEGDGSGAARDGRPRTAAPPPWRSSRPSDSRPRFRVGSSGLPSIPDRASIGICNSPGSRSSGDGVMLELAADGIWPACRSRLPALLQRANGTPWQATCVSPSARPRGPSSHAISGRISAASR